MARKIIRQLESRSEKKYSKSEGKKKLNETN